MRFKEFLTESSTGVDKWEKYFSNSEQFTKMKSDAPLYDENGKRIEDKIRPTKIAMTFFLTSGVSLRRTRVSEKTSISRFSFNFCIMTV